jgi:hypothetical protein
VEGVKGTGCRVQSFRVYRVPGVGSKLDPALGVRIP